MFFKSDFYSQRIITVFTVVKWKETPKSIIKPITIYEKVRSNEINVLYTCFSLIRDTMRRRGERLRFRERNFPPVLFIRSVFALDDGINSSVRYLKNFSGDEISLVLSRFAHSCRNSRVWCQYVRDRTEWKEREKCKIQARRRKWKIFYSTPDFLFHISYIAVSPESIDLCIP